MQLDTFNFGIIHPLFFWNDHDSLRTDNHFIKQKPVWSDITHNAQLHARFDFLFKLQALFQILKADPDVKPAAFITQIESEHHITGT